MTTAATVAPWAYIGTDSTPGVDLYPFTSFNSPPALVVWLILTTNTALASEAPTKPSIVKQIADAVNLTEPCVAKILAQFSSATENEENPAIVTQAFLTAIDSFHSIGDNPIDYPPDECPYLADILTLATPLKTFKPDPAPALQINDKKT